MTAQPQVLRGPGLELVVDRPVRRLRLRGWVVFTLAAVLAFLSLIYSRVLLDRSAFVLDDLEYQLEAAETRYWELRLEVARLESPERVVRAAEGMGLVYPTARRTIEAIAIDRGGAEVAQNWLELKPLLSAQP
jgi:cell division protein FtsL